MVIMFWFLSEIPFLENFNQEPIQDFFTAHDLTKL